MVIGIDASRANKDNRTGVEWYAFEIIENMKKILPNNIRVVLYSDEQLRGELANLPENWESKVLKWPPKKFWTQARLSIEMLLHKPDVLFIPAHTVPLIHPKKTVMTVHDIAAVRFPGGYSKFEAWYSVWSAKYAYKNVWKIICPSKFTADEMKNVFGYERKGVNVVPHGFDHKFFEEFSAEAVQKVKNKYKITKPYFIFCGRKEEKKNTARLVEAFSELDGGYQLALVGKEGYGYEKVKNAINRCPKKDDVIEPGWVAQEDLPLLYSGAVALAFPSLYEGFGIPVLEAYAAGIPVVTSDGSCLKEVGGEYAIYVDPLDTKSIREGLNKAVKSESKSEEARAYANNFSWRNAAEDTLKVLFSE